MTAMKPTLPLAFALGMSLCTGAFAQDSELPAPQPMDYVCESQYTTRVYVDGNQFDWEQEVEASPRVQQLIHGAYRYDWTGPNDASFMLWCRQSRNALHFAIVARDNAVVAPEDGKDGDHFEIWLQLSDPRIEEDEQLVMLEIPTHELLDTGSSVVTYGYGRSGTLAASRAEIAERTYGYFIEVTLPLASLGAALGFEPLRFAAVQRDWDYDGGIEYEVGVGTAPVDPDDPDSFGTLIFGEYLEAMERIREELSISEDVEPRLEFWEDIAGDGRKEYVALLGNHLIYTGDGLGNYDFASYEIVQHESHQPISLEFRDLDIDNEMEIVYRYSTQRGTGSTEQSITREFIAVLDPTGGGLEAVIHQEFAIEIEGAGRLEAELEYRDRGDYDIVRFRRAEGSLSRDAWIDLDGGQSVDHMGMLMPWDSRSLIDYYNYSGAWTSRVE